MVLRFETALMRDRREAPRKPELIMASVRSHAGTGAQTVILRNVSRTGAKLTVPTGMSLPEQFELDVPALGFTAVASGRWQLADEVGIVFMSSRPRPRLSSDNTLTRLFDLERELAELRGGGCVN